LSFALAKLVMVQLAVLLLGLNRHLRAAKAVEMGGAALYAVVVAHHLACLLQLQS
jgi:hypothetical protein